MFSTWAPKVIALIGRLPDTLANRAVVVPMRRRSPSEHVEHLRVDRLDELEPLRRMAARWAADNLHVLRVADPGVPAELHDRAADNWRPLLAIADCAGGQWPDSARRAAVLLSGAGADDDGSVRTLLLADLRAIFNGDERLASAAIVAALHEMEHRPWVEWRRGEPLTPRGLARLLEPFGVKPRQLWIDGAKTRGYKAADLEESWARYLSGDDGEPAVPGRTPVSGRSGRASASSELVPAPQAVGVEISTGYEGRGSPSEQGVLPDLPDSVPTTRQKELTPNPDRFGGMAWREQRAARLREILEREGVE